jgi:hypothetical protein
MRLTDEQIGAKLHALREVPSERFAAELDAWAAEGFPSLKEIEEPGTTSMRPVRGAPRLFGFAINRPALAAAGCLLVVMIVGVSVAGYLGSRGGSDSGTNSVSPFLSAPSRPESTNQSAKGSVAASQPDATVVPVPQTSRPRDARSQVQERTAQIGLATDADKVQDAADGVLEVTDRYDGIVDSSNVHTGGSNGRASFELRIPTQHLQDAISDLSDLGRVTLLNQGTTNVTGSYVDAGKAYRDTRARVDSLLEDLTNAPSPSAAASVKQELVVAREQLDAARTALRALKQHVAYTPVSVGITAHGDGSWSIGDAAGDAVGVLEAIGGATLVALAVLVPLSALLALGWFGGRELRRRRRDGALDR